MRDGFQGELPEMPWKNRYPPIDVTPEDNGPGADGKEPPFDEGDDDDMDFGWPVSQAAADILDSAYRFLLWRRGQWAKDV